MGCVSVSVVELTCGGSATSRATPSSFLAIIMQEEQAGERRSVELDALPVQAGGHHDHVRRPCHRGHLRGVGKPALGTQVREVSPLKNLLRFRHCSKGEGV